MCYIKGLGCGQSQCGDSSHVKHPWYALSVRMKHEVIVSALLRGKGYEEFLPTYRSRRQWSDRIKQTLIPLFPGYLFCRLNVRDRLLPILTTPGIIGIVGNGKTPVPIGEDEIAAVESVVRSGLLAQPWPFLTVGSRVLIERGPLVGLEGVVIRKDKKCRLVVSVLLLRRSVAVEIDLDWARPVCNSPESPARARAGPADLPVRTSSVRSD